MIRVLILALAAGALSSCGRADGLQEGAVTDRVYVGEARVSVVRLEDGSRCVLATAGASPTTSVAIDCDFAPLPR